MNATHYPRMRRGVSLVEMIVVIAVASALTGIAVSLLLVLFRAEQSGRTQIGQAESFQQFADQFRRDVHAAGDASVQGKDRQRCKFEFANHVIVRYMTDAHSIWREEQRFSTNLRMEPYTLPQDSTVTIEVDRAASPPVVSLMIKPKEASQRPGREFRIDAVLGRDLRFAVEEKEAK